MTIKLAKIVRLNKAIKTEILGIIVSQVVTIVGTPLYTSGAHWWKGAAATLNNRPTISINKPKATPTSKLFS